MQSGALARGALLAGILALSACTTAAQRQYQAMALGQQQAIQGIQTCIAAIRSAPDYAPVAQAIPANVNEATLQQLSNETSATDEQAAVIIATHPRIQECRRQALATLLQTSAYAVPILAANFTAQEDSLVLLIEKKITWAELLRRVREANAKAQAQLAAETQRVTADLNQQHQAEVAQRQAASFALMQWSQNQQIINAMNRPIVTNCTQFGSMASCVTR